MSGFRPAHRLLGVEKSAIRQFFDRAPAGSINLGLGEPDLRTPDVIRRAAVRAILEEPNGYTAQAGLRALRERIAGDSASCDGDPDRVVVTAGSQEALYLALTTVVDDGDEVLVPDPGFVAYATITRMAGGQPVFYPLPASRDFAFDRDAFRRAVSPKTKAVVVVSPSNPTGRMLDDEDLRAIADALAGTDALVVSDEIYRELYFDRRPPSVADYHSGTLVVAGLSKAMSMTGWRLGWLCGPADVVRSALVLHGYVTTCASTVSQKAALAAWGPAGSAARAAVRGTLRERGHQLLDLLKTQGLRAVTPDGAFYVMADVSAFGRSAAVAEAVLAGGVITVPGSAFGTQGEGFLRLSFAVEPALLTEGVRRMAATLGRLRPREEQPA
jgi:aspartate/methionine/tyrosine aminotransferase